MARAADSPPPLPRPAPAGPAPAPETLGLLSSGDPAPGCPATATAGAPGTESPTATVEEVSARHVPGTRIPAGSATAEIRGGIWPLGDEWDSAGQQVVGRMAPPGARVTSQRLRSLG